MFKSPGFIRIFHRSPAGAIYGDSLANALAVYLLQRYGVRRRAPDVSQGGVPGYCLKRVITLPIAFVRRSNALMSDLTFATAIRGIRQRPVVLLSQPIRFAANL